MAGLAAAKALCTHFESVTVLERDADGQQRRGVPQFQQPHVLLARGFRRSLRAAASPSASRDMFFFEHGVEFKREESDIRSVLSTRALIERTARELLLQQEPGVSLKSGAAVAGLVFAHEGVADGITEPANGARRRVAGVRLRDGSHLPADLVVDASGRSSSTPDWLAAGGFQRPPELKLDAKLGYAARFYERPARYEGLTAALVGAQPDYTRGAVLLPVEGNRWQLLLAGYAGDHPPTDEQGFADFIRSLKHPRIAEMLEGAKPVSPISRFGGTSNLRHLYEQIDMPPGMVVLGDAAATFNPIYGQGITVGVVEAQALKQLLDERVAAAGGELRAALAGLPNSFQQRAAEIVALPWRLATAEDSKWPVAEANFEVPQTSAWLRPYFAAVNKAASRDAAVFTARAQITHMLKPPLEALFAPQIVLKTLWHAVLLPRLAHLPLVGRYLAAAP